MKLIGFLLFFVVNSICFSYHHQFVFLQSAEQLYFRQVVPAISDRFLGVPGKDDGLFGQNLGANVAYSLKLGLGYNQVISYSGTSLYSQKSFSYKKSKNITDNNWIGGSINIDFITLDSKQNTTLSYIVFGGVVSEKFDLMLNCIYKDFFSTFQIGIGAAWQAIPKTKLFIELFTPVENYSPNAVILTGAKIMTFGHNFYFFVANQNEEGYIAATSGSDSNQFYSGFKIERIFDF